MRTPYLLRQMHMIGDLRNQTLYGKLDENYNAIAQYA